MTDAKAPALVADEYITKLQGDRGRLLAMLALVDEQSETINALQREKENDAWHRGWQVAVRERDEARAQRQVFEDQLNDKLQALVACEAQLAEAQEQIAALRQELSYFRDGDGRAL